MPPAATRGQSEPRHFRPRSFDAWCASGIRLTVNVKQDGRTTPVYVDFEFIRVGDAVAALVLVSGIVPFDDAERISGSPTSADLAALIAQRMDGLRAS
jgi:hypothetical protein